jgi:flavin-dependent dehydrogenase
LYYALRSAELCAEALLAGDPTHYRARLGEEILPELKLAARVSQRFYTGQIFGESILERIVALTEQSEGIRDLMSDLFAGTQSYRDLRSRLLRIVPSLMLAGLNESVRLPSRTPLNTYS